MARGQPPPEKELRHANGVMMLAPEVLPELIDALVKAKAEAVARGLLPADPHVERDVV